MGKEEEKGKEGTGRDEINEDTQSGEVADKLRLEPRVADRGDLGGVAEPARALLLLEGHDVHCGREVAQVPCDGLHTFCGGAREVFGQAGELAGHTHCCASEQAGEFCDTSKYCVTFSIWLFVWRKILFFFFLLLLFF